MEAPRSPHSRTSTSRRPTGAAGTTSTRTRRPTTWAQVAGGMQSEEANQTLEADQTSTTGPNDVQVKQFQFLKATANVNVALTQRQNTDRRRARPGRRHQPGLGQRQEHVAARPGGEPDPERAEPNLRRPAAGLADGRDGRSRRPVQLAAVDERQPPGRGLQRERQCPGGHADAGPVRPDGLLHRSSSATPATCSTSTRNPGCSRTAARSRA